MLFHWQAQSVLSEQLVDNLLTGSRSTKPLILWFSFQRQYQYMKIYMFDKLATIEYFELFCGYSNNFAHRLFDPYLENRLLHLRLQ